MKRLVLLLVMALLVAACQPTGDTAADPEAAQNLLPQLPEFETSDADSIIDALTTAGVGASVTTGNAPAAVLVQQVEAVTQCLQDVGAVAANVYVDNSVSVDNPLPRAGVIAVVNTSRVEQNLLQCAMSTGNLPGVNAQGVQLSPCADNGTFTYEGDDIVWLVAATDTFVCEAAALHFRRLAQEG